MHTLLSSPLLSSPLLSSPLPYTPLLSSPLLSSPPLASIRAVPRRGCKGPICIRTWNRGDASSIISLGISQRLLEE
ncbi:hypothetical protein WH47_06524 [Habropoda laboriosa]|uniref:Uncharacterized protein n=1 Tax=Habropoda laboriosa TaxID=597456 RepID=A0A0L7RCL4_9HYME|nr:hypothetical protein WH47_06524 [Habropoda laboriosa]